MDASVPFGRHDAIRSPRRPPGTAASRELLPRGAERDAMRISDTFRRSFVSGVVLVAPLVVTIVVLRVLFSWLLVVANPVVAETRLAQYTGNIEVAAQVLAIVALVVLVTVLGYVAQRGFGQRLFGSVGRIIDFVPLVSVVYGSARQMANSLVNQSSGYESVVLVEYPRRGVYSIGFVTGEATVSAESITDERVYNVFLPNSPNPTGGRLLLVPESDLVETELSPRAGLRTIVTTGMGERADPTLLDDIPAAD